MNATRLFLVFAAGIAQTAKSTHGLQDNGAKPVKPIFVATRWDKEKRMPKRKSTTNLETKMQAVIAGFVKTKKTSKGVARAEQRHNKAEYNLREAVNSYNLAVTEQIIAALVSQGLGLCEKRLSDKFHIANEAELMGIVLTGTRTTGGHYYEHDEHYVETYLKCKACRDKMNLRVGYDSLVELDVRAYWTKKLRDEVVDLYSASYIKEVLEWAACNGIAYLPITNQGNDYRLGESTLSYKPYKQWDYY